MLKWFYNNNHIFCKEKDIKHKKIIKNNYGTTVTELLTDQDVDLIVTTGRMLAWENDVVSGSK